MKLRMLVLALVVGLVGASAAFAAHPGKPAKADKAAKPAKPAKPAPKPHHKFGPYVIHTTDNGSCAPPPGHEWADLTLNRTYKVHKNHDGSFRVRSENKGTFVTRNERSPGACETDSKHGSTIRAGVTGKVHGFLAGRVTGGTYNPNATCPTECTTSAFITAFFGPSAQFTCFQGYADCRFSFKYTATKHQDLLFRHWLDAGLDGKTETFKGDIASA